MKQNIFIKEFTFAEYLRMSRRSAKVACAVSLILIILTSLYGVHVGNRVIFLTSTVAVIFDFISTVIIGARHGRAA